jgi:Tn3 transposase DDE domain
MCGTRPKALAEPGKAVKTIFLCRYLGDAALRREIHGWLNVVETWNSANGFIFFGNGGEGASNRLDDQEVSVDALHLLQSCLVYVNTLMLRRVLSEPVWMARMASADVHGLTPLVWGHVSPYGNFDWTWRPCSTLIGSKRPACLQNTHSVTSVVTCKPEPQGIADVPATPTKGQKKSSPDGASDAADRHERDKDYLSPSEVAKLLDAEGRPTRRSRPPAVAHDVPARALGQ